MKLKIIRILNITIPNGLKNGIVFQMGVIDIWVAMGLTGSFALLYILLDLRAAGGRNLRLYSVKACNKNVN
jgi:hypothetical protein